MKLKLRSGYSSVGNYAKVFFGPNKPLILKSLNALEERLDEKFFFRANRKHIVNLRMIEKDRTLFQWRPVIGIDRQAKNRGMARTKHSKFKEMMSL